MSTPNEGTPLQTAVRRRKTDEERQRERELMKRFRRYKCHECQSAYESEYSAQTCCGPETVYVCPSCEEHYCYIEDAQACKCGQDSIDDAPLLVARCPVCKELQADHEQAIECCLWKTMPFADRLQLERLVRYGRLDEAHAMLRSH